MTGLVIAIVILGLVHLVFTDRPKSRLSIAIGWNSAALVVLLAGVLS